MEWKLIKSHTLVVNGLVTRNCLFISILPRLWLRLLIKSSRGANKEFVYLKFRPESTERGYFWVLSGRFDLVCGSSASSPVSDWDSAEEASRRQSNVFGYSRSVFDSPPSHSWLLITSPRFPSTLGIKVTCQRFPFSFHRQPEAVMESTPGIIQDESLTT